MKRVTVTLVGSVAYRASRSFVVELPDDVNPKILDQQVLESIADEARIPWIFDAEGFVHTTDHFVEELNVEPGFPSDVNRMNEAA